MLAGWPGLCSSCRLSPVCSGLLGTEKGELKEKQSTDQRASEECAGQTSLIHGLYGLNGAAANISLLQASAHLKTGGVQGSKHMTVLGVDTIMGRCRT